MTPISPVLTLEFQDKELVMGKDQPEYITLPAIRGKGVVLTRWKPNDIERKAIAEGADIYLSLYTGDGPMQPVKVETAACAMDVLEIAHNMGLL